MLLLVVMSEPSCRHAFETDGERTAAIAITDKAEEQAGLIAVHRVVPHLVDQQQRTGHVLSALQPGGWHMCVGPQRGRQRVEAVVLDRETDLDRPDSEAHEEVAFPNAWRTLHQDHLGVPDP
jgi:hypothetical protein